ncbi:hypothetical protein B0H15DRAFT_764748, partial [Mycena belliarum]
PPWFRAVYGEITAKNLGGTFNALLVVYAELEQTYKWDKGSSKGLGKLNRPTAVDKWVGVARGARSGAMANGVGPPIGSIAKYEESWWRWWGGLQPDWRVSHAGRPGQFARVMGPGSDDTNSWATLRHPGVNGVLSLLASLYWWGKAVQEKQPSNKEEMESWVEAIGDVKWMITGL